MPWIERVRTEQPLDAGVGIDLSNKFGAAFVTGVFGNLGIGISATGKLTTVSAGAENDGRLISFSGAGGNKVDIGPVVLASTSGMSIAAMSKKTTGHAFNSPIFDNKGFADWANSPGFAFVVRPDGGLLFYIATSETYSTTNLFNDAKFHTSSAIWKPGVSQDIYVDGVKPSYTSSAIAGSYTNTTTQLKLGTYYDLSGGRSGAQKIAYALLFKVAFSPAEMQELHANPWQLFEKERIFVPLTTGGDIAAITQADGISTAGTLGGAASAASTPTAADGTSTAASIAASATAAAGVTQADGASTAATLVGVASTGSTITQADGSTVASVLAGSATSSAAATQADGVSTVGTLAGSATAASVLSSADGSSSTSTAAGSATSAAALTQADGLSTVSTLTGAGTGIAAFTQADGVSTTGTLTGTGLAAGSSTITPAAGSTTAGAIAGSSTAIAAITQADGTTTAGTLSSSSVSPAVMTAGAGTSTTSTLAGSSIFAAAMTQASGATTASAFAASAVAACVAIAAAGASSAQALAGIPPNTSNLAGIIYEVPEDVRSSIVLADARGFTVLEDVRSTATTI